MSRVFEALTRAAKEVEETSGNSTSDSWVWSGKAPPEDQLSARSADDAQLATIVPPHHKPRLKSWRERMEDLLFGWDLKRYKRYPIVALEKDSQTAEQYKILREQVKRLRSETKARVLSVTSPVKRDGKSTVAANLAAALALDYEEKVLLIDGDLRSPTIHRYFGLELTPGLTDYLKASSNGNLAGYVQQTSLPGLLILSAGEPSGFASELLAKDRMRSLLEEIRITLPEHQIIVDTGPVLSSPDSLIVARQVDGIIMVVRAGKTPRRYLKEALQSLNSTKVMGVVLNGVEAGIASKYYYDSNNHRNL